MYSLVRHDLQTPVIFPDFRCLKCFECPVPTSTSLSRQTVTWHMLVIQSAQSSSLSSGIMPNDRKEMDGQHNGTRDSGGSTVRNDPLNKTRSQITANDRERVRKHGLGAVRIKDCQRETSQGVLCFLVPTLTLDRAARRPGEYGKRN